jgi:hypothetical protein
VEYAPFSDSYFIRSDHYQHPDTGAVEEDGGRWPKGKPFPVWWIKADGYVKRIELPYTEMLGGPKRLHPTQSGLFFLSGHVGFNGQHSTEGYLIQDGRAMKVIRIGGMIQDDGVSVSPNGCKVAFVYDPDDTQYIKDREHRITVKMIDVC